MKRIILSLFIIFGISSHCFGANNATDVYLLAQTKNATELKNVENIDVVDSDGNTALCSAIKYNDVNAYNMLKNAGANTEHKCIKKIPAEQYQAFIQKVATASQPWSFLGMGKLAWTAIGAGVAVGAGAVALSGGGSGGNENTTSGTNNQNTQNTNPTCQEQGYTYKYSDSCPDGWIKNSNDYCNMNDGTGVWFKCDVQQTCSESYHTECGNGYEEVPGDICLSGTTVYKKCVNAACNGFNYSQTQGCPDGWEQGDSCLSGTVMKYKCDVPAICNGYQSSCATGYLTVDGDTCKSGNNILVKCVFDSENYVIQGGVIYPRLNCVNGTQTGNTCSCTEGWTGDLCDTLEPCVGYQSSCDTGYNITSTCQSGNTTLVQCEFDSENYVLQGGIVYPKLNCVNGNQIANTCSCNNGWTGDLCNTPEPCVGYQSSCDTGYNITSTCQSGNTTLVQCEFDTVNYIIQGGIVYEKLNCVNGNQTANTCSCNVGWTGILCDTPTICSGYQPGPCGTGYLLVNGDTCQSGDDTLIKCEFDNENYIIQGGIVYPKLSCVNGTQTGNACSCTNGWDGDLCDTPATCDGYLSSCPMGYNITSTCQSGDTTLVQCDEFDDEHYIIQNGIIYPKLNCENGNQVANTCSCNVGWTGDLCDTPATCTGYQSSCDTGYIVSSTCQSGDNTLVQCVFDDENYIIQGGIVYPKLACVNGSQTGNTCSCTEGWDGELCDTPATCNYHTTECTGGYIPTGNRCRSGLTEYIECGPIQCSPGQAWTPSGCVTQTNVVINNTSSTGTVYGRYNEEANADNISANIIITNSASSDVMAMFLGSMYFDTANVRVHTQSLQPGNENITGNITINNSTDNEIYGIFSDEWAGNARNLYYDHANLNEHSLNLISNINITDTGNTGEVVGMNGRNWRNGNNISNLYIDQSGTGETWLSAHINANITINNLGDKPVYGIRGFNLYNAYSNYEINTIEEHSADYGLGTVKGTINIINNGDGDAFGMYLKPLNGTNTAVNSHNADAGIAIWNKGSGNAYGMYGSNLVNMDNSGLTTGFSDIALYNYADGNAYGMYGSQISNENTSLSDYNSLVELYNFGTGTAVGIYATDTVMNSGAVTLNNTGTGTAIGIFGDTNSTITNSGAISISRNGFIDSDNILHSPTGTAGDVFGIYAKSGSTVNNSGFIEITTNGNAYGIYVEPESTVINTGTISINGVSCSGSSCNTDNYIVLNGSTLYNSGVVAVPQMNLNMMGGNVVAGLGSQFIVENELSGDLNISSEIVQNGNQTTYIAENMIDAGDVSGLNVRSASAMFNASLADNGHDIVMQMKGFNELTDNKSLATFLANNYANGKGMGLFDTLKSMDNVANFNGALSGLTGLNTFTQFAHEDLSAMREISFSMNNKLFENSGRDSFDISGGTGYFSFSNGHNNGSGQYGISSEKISENWKLGYGMAMANISTGDGDNMHRQNKLWLFYMPATYTNDGYELVIAPKAGFSHSEYSRRGYNDINYDGYIDKQIFGLMNDLRYPLNFGNWTIAPDLALNTIIYDQNGHENEQEFSLVIPDDRTVSIETGLGFYTKYEKNMSNGGKFTLNSGLMLYREFGDTYDIKLGIRGMDGTFNLYNTDYKYRGAASLGFDYATGRFHLYGNAQYFMDNDNYMNFKGGVSYRF